MAIAEDPAALRSPSGASRDPGIRRRRRSRSGRRAAQPASPPGEMRALTPLVHPRIGVGAARIDEVDDACRQRSNRSGVLVEAERLGLAAERERCLTDDEAVDDAVEQLNRRSSTSSSLENVKQSTITPAAATAKNPSRAQALEHRGVGDREGYAVRGQLEWERDPPQRSRARRSTRSSTRSSHRRPAAAPIGARQRVPRRERCAAHEGAERAGVRRVRDQNEERVPAGRRTRSARSNAAGSARSSRPSTTT